MNWRIFALLMSSLSLLACGTGSVGSLNYEGITTPVDLNEDNAKELVIEGLESAGVSGASGANAGNAGNARDSVVLRSKLLARKMMNKIQARSENDDNGLGDIFESSTVEGACGGSMTTQFPGNVDYSDLLLGGEFSLEIEMLFDNFCDEYDDVKNIMSGKILTTMKVTKSQNENVKVTMVMEFIDIASKEGDREYLMAGTVAIISEFVDILNGESKMTLNLVMQDIGNNTMYQFEDFMMNVSYAFDFSSGLEMKVSYAGRVYNSNDGYLDITTNEVLVFTNAIAIDVPRSGELEFNGANNSAAKLIFNADSSYEFQLDSNGDGIVDKTEIGATIELSDSELFGAISELNF